MWELACRRMQDILDREGADGGGEDDEMGTGAEGEGPTEGGEGEDAQVQGPHETSAEYAQQPRGMKPALPQYKRIVGSGIQEERAYIADKLRDIREQMQHTAATILTDGRKSLNSEPIVNFLAAGQSSAFLFTTVRREGVDAEMSDVVLQRWKKVFEKFDAKNINAIYTDSASVYVAAGRALCNDPDPDICRIPWLPCFVHCYNLMLSDMVKDKTWAIELLTRERAVVRFIRSHGSALPLFRIYSVKADCDTRVDRVGGSAAAGEGTAGRARCGRELLYPCQTRFASMHIMMERLLGRRVALETMMLEGEWTRLPWERKLLGQDGWVRTQVRCGLFWEEMDDLIDVFILVVQLLRRLDQGGLVISCIFWWVTQLAEEIRKLESTRPRLVGMLQECYARACHLLQPAHAAAYLLNPKRRNFVYFQSSDCTDQQKKVAQMTLEYIYTQTRFDRRGERYMLVRQRSHIELYGKEIEYDPPTDPQAADEMEAEAWMDPEDLEQGGSDTPDAGRKQTQVVRSSSEDDGGDDGGDDGDVADDEDSGDEREGDGQHLRDGGEHGFGSGDGGGPFEDGAGGTSFVTPGPGAVGAGVLAAGRDLVWRYRRDRFPLAFSGTTSTLDVYPLQMPARWEAATTSRETEEGRNGDDVMPVSPVRDVARRLDMNPKDVLEEEHLRRMVSGCATTQRLLLEQDTTRAREMGCTVEEVTAARLAAGCTHDGSANVVDGGGFCTEEHVVDRAYGDKKDVGVGLDTGGLLGCDGTKVEGQVDRALVGVAAMKDVVADHPQDGHVAVDDVVAHRNEEERQVDPEDVVAATVEAHAPTMSPRERHTAGIDPVMGRSRHLSKRLWKAVPPSSFVPVSPPVPSGVSGDIGRSMEMADLFEQLTGQRVIELGGVSWGAGSVAAGTRPTCAGALSGRGGESGGSVVGGECGPTVIGGRLGLSGGSVGEGEGAAAAATAGGRRHVQGSPSPPSKAKGKSVSWSGINRVTRKLKDAMPGVTRERRNRGGRLTEMLADAAGWVRKGDRLEHPGAGSFVCCCATGRQDGCTTVTTAHSRCGTTRWSATSERVTFHTCFAGWPTPPRIASGCP
ncbi:hypothetical protein CBR_g39940 [Chara braunii]|uniref:DUF659 domain-containing protein n=1 Tax=Chara braunii TaxID=69332 RepID=A0A388K1L7_CHABU|nr:hypothetical protein CBR_g39940 [Chara braunii]|eukprot:GBG63936.1 hypothetical protein CBR_g39940 [Chara braunii]